MQNCHYWEFAFLIWHLSWYFLLLTAVQWEYSNVYIVHIYCWQTWILAFKRQDGKLALKIWSKAFRRYYIQFGHLEWKLTANNKILFHVTSFMTIAIQNVTSNQVIFYISGILYQKLSPKRLKRSYIIFTTKCTVFDTTALFDSLGHKERRKKKNGQHAPATVISLGKCLWTW